MQKPPQSLQTIEHHARIAIRGTQGHSVYRKVVPDPQAEHHARIAAEFESLIKPHTALGVFGHKSFGRVAEAQPKGFCDDVGAAGGLAKRSSNKLVLSDDPRGGSAPGIGDARGSKAGCCSVRFAKRSSIVFLSSTSTSDTVRALWPKAPRASVRAKRAPNESSRLGADVSEIALGAVNAAAVPSSGLALAATFLLMRVATSFARLPTPFQKLPPSESAAAARTPSRSFHSRR